MKFLVFARLFLSITLVDGFCVARSFYPETVQLLDVPFLPKFRFSLVLVLLLLRNGTLVYLIFGMVAFLCFLV